MLSIVIECTWMALEWRTPNRHTKTKDENLLSSSTQELYTKVLANATDEVCNFNQCTRRNGYRENAHRHIHTMSSREKLHSLFSISFFANISQQFMLFFLSFYFWVVVFFNQVIYFYFSRSLQHTRIMELAQPLTKTLWPIFSFAEHFILFRCTGEKKRVKVQFV